MQTLTCSVPQNINPLQTNGFLFNINKYPDIKYFCTEANIPSIDLPAAINTTRFIDIPNPGDKLEFGDLQLTFLIDEDMRNYKAIYTWLVGLGFPKNNEQFADFIKRQTDGLNTSIATASASDAILQVLNSANNPVATIQYYDIIPISLSSLQFTSTTDSTTYFAGQALFKYTLFEFI